MTGSIPTTALAALFGALAAPGATSQDLTVDALFERWSGGERPGAVVLVARGDEIVHHQPYGLSAVDTAAANDTDTVMQVGSVAKVMTGAAMAHLVAHTDLSFDDRIRAHIPELPECCATITIQHLLNHRSGLRDFFELLMLRGQDLDAAIEPTLVMELLARQPALNFEPGSACLYSNTNYFLLAQLIERASGMSLREYAAEHLFGPLGMDRTTFRDDPDQEIADAAAGHEPTGDGYRARRSRFALPGSGGLYTTTRDLLSFTRALRSGRHEWLAATLEPPALGPDQSRDPMLGNYARGIMVRAHGQRELWMHQGGSFGYQAIWMHLPTDDLTVIVLGNCADLPAVELGQRLLTHFLPADSAARGVPGGLPMGPSVFEADDGEIVVLFSRDGQRGHLASMGWKIDVEGVGPGRFRDRNAGIATLGAVDGDRLTLRVGSGGERVFERRSLGPSEAASGLAGTWRCDEIGADLQIRARGGMVQLVDEGMGTTLPPFAAIRADLWISDKGLRIDVEERSDGTPVRLRLGTPRARGLLLVRTE